MGTGYWLAVSLQLLLLRYRFLQQWQCTIPVRYRPLSQYWLTRGAQAILLYGALHMKSPRMEGLTIMTAFATNASNLPFHYLANRSCRRLDRTPRRVRRYPSQLMIACHSRTFSCSPFWDSGAQAPQTLLSRLRYRGSTGTSASR